MTRSQRIKKIVKLTENRERTAAREFASAQKTLQDFKERLQQLCAYRQEYLDYLKPNGETHSIRDIRQRQAFVLQIDEGVRMLKEQIKLQESMNTRERDKWLKEKQQLDTMENIFERFYKAEQQVVALREQHQLDELSHRQPRS